MPWPFIDFPAAIEKTAVGKENQILSSEIERSGRFPVIDQGQAFIAGYSNAEERVIREGLPLVILRSLLKFGAPGCRMCYGRFMNEVKSHRRGPQ
jgi:hypothetical protein